MNQRERPCVFVRECVHAVLHRRIRFCALDFVRTSLCEPGAFAATDGPVQKVSFGDAQSCLHDAVLLHVLFMIYFEY